MLSKSAKFRVLEGFYSIDYIFFGKPVSEVEYCCPLVVEEYLATKGTLMGIISDMFKLSEFSPQIGKIPSKRLLHERAKRTAETAKEHASSIIKSQKAVTEVKQIVRESIMEGLKDDKIDELVEDEIQNKAFSIAIDSLLIARTLNEYAKFVDLLNSRVGTILEDSYKSMRTCLVEFANLILSSEKESKDE